MTGPIKPQNGQNGDDDQSSPEKQGEALRARGVVPGATSASGHAAAGSPKAEKHFGKEPDDPGAGDTILKPAKSVGKQLEPALMTPGGSIEPGTVPSPSGPVPASAISDDRVREEAVKAAKEGTLDQQRLSKNSRRKLTQEDLDRMSPAEVRAVAADRGYVLPIGGRRSTIRHFLTAQDEDKGLEDTGAERPSERPLSTAAARTTTRPATQTARTGTAPTTRSSQATPTTQPRPVPAPGTAVAGGTPESSRPTPPPGSGINPGDTQNYSR